MSLEVQETKAFFAAVSYTHLDVYKRQCPDYVDAGDIESTLSELAGRLLSTGRADPAAARDGVMHTMA